MLLVLVLALALTLCRSAGMLIVLVLALALTLCRSAGMRAGAISGDANVREVCLPSPSPSPISGDADVREVCIMYMGAQHPPSWPLPP